GLMLGGSESRSMDERSWPFPVAKPESDWSAFDRDYFALMRTAYAEGYQPRAGPCNSVELGSWPVCRCASLIFRGSRNGWEPFLGDSGRSRRLGPSYGLPLGEHACVCVRPPFRDAAHLVLEWMRGRSLASLLEEFEFVGGRP